MNEKRKKEDSSTEIKITRKEKLNFAKSSVAGNF